MSADQIDVLVILLVMSTCFIAALLLVGLLSYFYFWLKGKK